MRKRGLTNRWLAERINVNIRTINKIYNKSTIDTQQLLAISKALGINFFQYFSDDIEAALRNAPRPEDDAKA